MLAEVARRRGQYDKALSHLSLALEIATPAQFESSKALVHDAIGRIYFERENFGEAAAHLNRAYEIRVAIRDRLMQLYSLGAMARVEMARGDLAKARSYLARLEEGVRPLGLIAETWRFWHLKGEFHEQEGQGEEALQSLREAARQIETLRERLRTDDLRTGYVEDKQEVYESLIRVATRLGRHAEAFEAIERAKSRAFLDLLAQRRQEAPRALAGVPEGKYEELDQAQRILEAEIRALESGQAAAPRPEEEMMRKSQQLREVVVEREAVARQLVATNARVLHITARPASLEELQARIPSGAVLLNYYLSKRVSVVGILDREGVQVVEIQPAPEEEILAFARLLADPASTGWEGHAERLFARLIGPVAHKLHGKTALIMVPHRALHYLPVSALRTPQGDFLGAGLSVSYLPSASVLRFLPDPPATGTRSVLGVANPTVPGLPALPGAEAEVRGIAALLPTRVIANEKATKPAVVGQSRAHRLLHFATHGELDVQRPMQSSLRLSPSEGNDGRLTVDEVFNLTLQADMAVLSACSTGLGAGFTGEAVSPGDELVGFSRAFLYAGARSLVVTLWPVADESTAQLMVEFYRNLRTMPKAEALRQAQAALVGRGQAAAGLARDVRVRPTDTAEARLAHPFYWAPFILIGDGQ